MALGILSKYYNFIGRAFYVRIPLGLLLLNWIVQRIFRVNADVPFSVNYTNKITGWENCYFEDDIVKANLCLSGGAYITVFEGTKLEVGAGTIWAYNICIQTGNHKPGKLDVYEVDSVRIGKNCWIGNGAAILAGVTLGDNVTVGANSVVTKSFPSNVVIAGVPAKIIRELL
ncbi:N/A [soil metagenome]